MKHDVVEWESDLFSYVTLQSMHLPRAAISFRSVIVDLSNPYVTGEGKE